MTNRPIPHRSWSPWFKRRHQARRLHKHIQEQLLTRQYMYSRGLGDVIYQLNDWLGSYSRH